jgi:hypothetical protein
MGTEKQITAETLSGPHARSEGTKSVASAAQHCAVFQPLTSLKRIAYSQNAQKREK